MTNMTPVSTTPASKPKPRPRPQVMKLTEAAAQGLGIGRQLLKEADHRARVGGASRIELTSGSQRTEAHAFYRACGYKDSSVRFVKQLGE